MRLIVLGLLLISFLSPRQQTVMVCKSGTAYAYHNKICQGLKECSHKIENITLADAEIMGRKPCKYCYRSVGPSNPSSDGQCMGITKKGSRCTRKAGPNGYCWQHG